MLEKSFDSASGESAEMTRNADLKNGTKRGRKEASPEAHEALRIRETRMPACESKAFDKMKGCKRGGQEGK